MVISEKIIRACQARDGKAEQQLYRLLAPRVLTLCRRYARDEAEALDFLQECWIVLFDKIGRYDSTRGAFEPWAWRVSTNCVLMQLRSQQRYPPLLEQGEEGDDLYDTSESDQVTEIYSPEVLLEAIRQLPEGYRRVINLSVFEEWDHDRIGRELGISAGSSRSQLTRAKRALRRILEKKRTLSNESRRIG